MKKQKTQSRIIIAMSIAILLLVALSATLTFAYFTDSASLSNQTIRFGKLDLNATNITIADADSANFKHIDASGATYTLDKLVPGCKFTLAGEITLASDIQTFVRSQLSVTVADSNGENDETVTTYAAQDLIAAPDNNQKAQIVFNKIYAAAFGGVGGTWLSNDGWLYKTTSQCGPTVSVVNFNNALITFEAASFGNAWMDKVITISISAQAIQADHILSEEQEYNKPNADTGVFTVSSSNVAELAAHPAWTADKGFIAD